MVKINVDSELRRIARVQMFVMEVGKLLFENIYDDSDAFIIHKGKDGVFEGYVTQNAYKTLQEGRFTVFNYNITKDSGFDKERLNTSSISIVQL